MRSVSRVTALEVPSTDQKGSSGPTSSGLTLVLTAPPDRSAPAMSLCFMPRPAAFRASPVEIPLIPVRSTFLGFVPAPMRTFARAAIFTAASHPSMSREESSSVTPILLATSSASSMLAPRAISPRTTLEVVFNRPLMLMTSQPGSVLSTRLNTGAPSMTVPSNLKWTPLDRARELSSS